LSYNSLSADLFCNHHTIGCTGFCGGSETSSSRSAEGFFAEVGWREELTWAAQAWYANPVKNITVSVDDETYRRARTKAAERDTSLSALVRRFLVELVSEESSERGLERQERDLRAQIRDFTAGDRLSREDAHGRRE
jgi:hypothetical protein